MKKILLLELLNILEKKEQKYLYSFIDSEYWDLREEDKNLIGEFIDQPDLMVKIYQREAISPKFKYQKGRIVKVLEAYFHFKLMSKEIIHKELLLADFYNEKGLEKNYQAKMKAINNLLLKRPLDNETGYLIFKYNETLAKHSRVNRSEMPELTDMIKGLNQFYQENIARLSCEFKNHKEIINTSYIKGLEDITMSVFSETALGDVYKHIIGLLENLGDFDHYNHLKKVIEEEEFNLAADIEETLYVHLMNYCIKEMNKGHLAFADEYIYWIKKVIAKGYFLANGILDTGRYRNTITAYLVSPSQNYKKARVFIEQYSGFLATDQSEDLKNINLVRILLFEQNYVLADQLLSKIPYGKFDFYYKILHRQLEIKLLYERVNTNEALVLSRLDNFRGFINNKKILRGGKKIVVLRNFIRLMQDLIDSDTQQIENRVFNREYIESKLLSLTDKTWFLSKL
jgi:hypothetical protein